MVEKWLQEVQVLMIQSMQDICSTSLKAYSDAERSEWILTWPGQIVQCCNCVNWTTEATNAILNNALVEYHDKCTLQIEQSVKLVQGKLSPGNQVTVEALIVIDVHGKL